MPRSEAPDGDGSRGITDPFAPRAGIQTRTGESGVLQREQVLAGSDARTAHRDDARRRQRAEHRSPASPQLVGRQETAIRAEIVEEGPTAGAGHVTCDRI